MNEHMMYLAAVAWANGGTLRGADLVGANLRFADLAGADLRDAHLSRASLEFADLSGANLRRADLGGANLAGASLEGADLVGASLESADLAGASLEGAELGHSDLRGDTLAACIATAERMDGFTFHLFRLADGAHKVMAGCRWMTIDDYRAHVAARYPDTDKARETLDILDYFERRAA